MRFIPGRICFYLESRTGRRYAEFGQAARGMPREYAEGFRDHKQAIFEDFQQLIPALEKSFPDHTIVVRPHPTENQEIYRKIADALPASKCYQRGQCGAVVDGHKSRHSQRLHDRRGSICHAYSSHYPTG